MKQTETNTLGMHIADTLNIVGKILTFTLEERLKTDEFWNFPFFPSSEYLHSVSDTRLDSSASFFVLFNAEISPTARVMCITIRH